MPPKDPDDEFPDSDLDDDDELEARDRREEEAEDEDDDEDDYRLYTLERHARRIETLLALTISAMVVFTVGVNWYLLKQARLTRGLVHQQRGYVNNVQKAFDARSANVREFITSLERYAMDDPEFKEILEKHRKDLGKYYTTKGGADGDASPTPDE